MLSGQLISFFLAELTLNMPNQISNHNLKYQMYPPWYRGMYQLVQIKQLSSYKRVQAIWFAHLRDDQGLTEQEIYEWCVRYLIFCLFARSPQCIFLTVEFWDGNMLDGFAWLPWCLWFGGIFRGWIKCQLMMLIIVVNRLSQMKIWCMRVFKNLLANIVRRIVSPKSSFTRISLEFPLFIFDHNRYFL